MGTQRFTLSRRQLLERIGVASGAFAGAQLLAACTAAPAAPQSQPATAPLAGQAVKPTTAPAAVTAGGGQITMMVQAGAPQTAAIKAFAPDFTKATGTVVNLVEVPTGDMYTKLMVEISAGASSYDLVTLNNTALLGAAQYLEDVEALGMLPADIKSDMAPAALDTAKDVNGAFRGLPHFVTCTGLYSRTDLLAAKGLKPPTTWDEWLNAAQQTNDPAKSVWGTVIQASTKTTAGGSRAAEWSYQNGGGIVDERGKPTINRSENAEALKYIAAFVNQYKVAPPSAADITHVEINNFFNQGRAAMVLNPQYMANMSRDPQQSKVVDQYTVSAYPKNKRGGVFIGGWFLSIPTVAKNKAGAIAFAKALVTPEEQIRLIGQEGICARISVMDTTKYPQAKQNNPYIDAFGSMIAEIGMPYPKWAKLDDILRRLAVANQQIISKQSSAEDALAAAQKDISDLVG